MSYELRFNPTAKDSVFTPRGGNKEFFYSKAAEMILAGPSETGKTTTALWLLHLTACKYPGLELAIVRKRQTDVYGSVLVTFKRIIAGAPVIPYGAEKPERFIYPNGSQIWIGGMDKGSKVLSSERYIIYVNQAEELTLNDWELLTTRVTGRGFKIPNARLIGDANPAGSKHWIRTREKLKLFSSHHEDNPSLFDNDGKITDQGVITLDRLDSLTGLRYKRLRQGLWVTAEGVVYDNFNPEVHVVKREDSEFGRWFLAIDEGYTNPAVILLVGCDSDDRLHIAREFYETGVLQGKVVERAGEWKKEKGVSLVAVDASAAGLIADLLSQGISAEGAKGRVLDRIQKIQQRLKVQPDRKPRLTVDPSCVNTINEFESYIWKVNREGVGKDEPLKLHDHAMDALGYLNELILHYADIDLQQVQIRTAPEKLGDFGKSKIKNFV